jgi:hypothetical protein
MLFTILLYVILYIGDLTRHQDQNKSSVSKEATHIVMVSIYILTESYTIIHYNKAVINWFQGCNYNKYTENFDVSSEGRRPFVT